jgi:hypothetical protein
MHKPLVFAALLALPLSLASGVASAQDDEASPAASGTERPSTGIGYLVTGGVLTGVGGLNLLTAPLCTTSLITSDLQSPCLIASLVVAGVGLAVGIPLIVVGANKRAEYNEWKKAHPVAAGLWVVPTAGGAAIGWHADF